MTEEEIEARRIRELPKAQFVEWFRQKYALEYCRRNPRHLTGSYEHHMECEEEA